MTPKDLKYTKKHEWIRLEGGKATVGITDHAQELLGDITFVELPAAGKAVRQSEPLAVVESVKATSDVYSPASGKVCGVNSSLEGSPGTINKDPYGAGWICRLENVNPSEINGLLSAEDYEKFISEK